ncbi:MAG: fluoride efflux transporter CrcB, partial [Spirochaetaceae bacterium]|nr:fluoride efflux transporter CrcB [Spirochaetaceae bacterium]
MMGTKLFHWVFVVAGGGLGALLRYLSIRAVGFFNKTPFPWGTLAVNAAGSLLIGFFIGFFDRFSFDAGWKLFVITGFLGGYTTFSTYSLETARFFMSGNIVGACMNLLFSNALCILCAGAGMRLSALCG